MWSELIDEVDAGPVGTGPWWRSVPAEVTLARISPVLLHAGITRLADVTGLDWVGLPVYQAIRPASRNMVVSLGKGLTPIAAKVSAAMESIECFHAEDIRLRVRRETPRALRHEIDYAIESLPRTAAESVGSLDRVFDWLPAIELGSGRPSFVPRELCTLDFRVSNRLSLPRFANSSNGLASGNTLTEALLHGLCELIERDCLARVDAAWQSAAGQIDCSAIEDVAIRDVLAHFERADASVYLFDRTNAIGVPCMDAFVFTANEPPVRGAGCHPLARVAVLRALTEAAQGRIARIAGARDDLVRGDYTRRSAAPPPAWGQPTGYLPAPAAHYSGANALSDVIERITRCTGMAPLAVDLRRSEFGVPVVFTLAPGLSPPACRAQSGWYPRAARMKPLSARHSGSTPVRVAVYLGPTLSTAHAQELCDGLGARVELHPPIEQGDLLRQLADPPSAVLIIDGCFFQVPAVLHQEILLLLGAGVHVVGASSMGALRAAELHAFGMVGVGEVFRQYASAEIEADDEVAVLHAGAELGHLPYAESLVNIRARLQHAAQSGAISRHTAELAEAVARGLHFSRRTAREVARGLPAADRAVVARVLCSNAIDVKRDDAIAAFSWLRARLSGDAAWPQARSGRSVEATKYSALQQRSYAGSVVAGFELPDAFVLSIDKLVTPTFAAFRRDAMLRWLAAEQARAEGLQVVEPERLMTGFFERRGARGSVARARWLRDALLSEAELCSELVDAELARQLYELRATHATRPAIARQLLSELARRHGVSARELWRNARFEDRRLIVAAKVHGQFEAIRQRAAGMLRLLGDRAVHSSQLDGRFTSQRLQRQVARRWRIHDSQVAGAARNRGFGSNAELDETARLVCAHTLAVTLIPYGLAGRLTTATTSPRIEIGA